MSGHALTFRVLARSGAARRGRLETPHGPVETPAFMPVGTQAAVKGLTVAQLGAVGPQMLLCNTYHLHLRPGEDVIARLGGLHRFMGWEGPLLTDSGGFQVHSLAAQCRVDDDGVSFQSHIDGAKVRLEPERVVRIQEALGADVAMTLDVCLAAAASRAEHERAVARTVAWAARAHAAARRADQATFPIVQGGGHEDLRRQCARALVALDFPGYAIGGLGLGEGQRAMLAAAQAAVAELPEGRPRYLMGVGFPADLLAAVDCGVDLFDCVLPTRHARHGEAFTAGGRLRLRHAVCTADGRPVEADCDCWTCARHSRAYLRHLVLAGESLAGTLLSLHNLRFFERLMGDMRRAIEQDRWAAFCDARRPRPAEDS